MGADEVKPIRNDGATDQTEKRTRERSTVEFPYSDLGSAIELVRMINTKAGNECESAQLAAWMGQSATGGTFRSRYSAARLFGLIETGRGGRVKLTSLGNEVLGAAGADKAKAQAFLNVELFRQLYEERKGLPLPPPPALQRMVTTLGVAPKQAERARQTFMKSAQVAQFIDQQTGAFIEPAFKPSSEADPPADDDRSHTGKKGGGGSDGNEPPALDPIIKGLIARLPAAGEEWPSEQRELWLNILKNAFQLVYKEGNGHSEGK